MNKYFEQTSYINLPIQLVKLDADGAVRGFHCRSLTVTAKFSVPITSMTFVKLIFPPASNVA